MLSSIKRAISVNVVISILCVFFTQVVYAEFELKNSVVNIINYSTIYNYAAPWQTPTQEPAKTGTGFIIEGRKIITNAHVAENGSFIQVRLAGNDKKYVAKLEIIDHTCDLAILSIEDDEFWINTIPLRISDRLPELREKVMALGFPIGGREFTVTEGIISRIEMISYVAAGGFGSMPAAQIDASTWPGSSGGPVISLSTGEVVGVTHQGATGLNINYTIPATVVRHFLNDANTGNYKGFVHLPIKTQKMENSVMRKEYGMTDSENGVLVNWVHSDFSKMSGLKVDDVILSLNSYNVSNDGNITLDSGNRVSALHAVSEVYYGDVLKVVVLRKGEKKTLNIVMNVKREDVTKVDLLPYDKQPDYYIYSGVVFQDLSVNFLRFWGKDWGYVAPIPFLNSFYNEDKDTVSDRVVIINSILANDLTSGYQSINSKTVTEINGKKINNLSDVINAIEQHKGATHTIIFDKNYKIIIKNISLEENKEIMLKHKISSDRSAKFENLKV